MKTQKNKICSLPTSLTKHQTVVLPRYPTRNHLFDNYPQHSKIILLLKINDLFLHCFKQAQFCPRTATESSHGKTAQHSRCQAFNWNSHWIQMGTTNYFQGRFRMTAMCCISEIHLSNQSHFVDRYEAYFRKKTEERIDKESHQGRASTKGSKFDNTQCKTCPAFTPSELWWWF